MVVTLLSRRTGRSKRASNEIVVKVIRLHLAMAEKGGKRMRSLSREAAIPDISQFLAFFLFLAAAIVLLLGGCATVQRPPVTVPQIVQMSKDGVPPKDIIQKIRDSGTVYRLKASQLAKLKDEGVSDPVLNYMQQTYINSVRKNQSLEDWDNWTMENDGFWYGGFGYGWPEPWYSPLP